MQVTNIKVINNNLLTVIDNLILIYKAQLGTLKKIQEEYVPEALLTLQAHARSMTYLVDTLLAIEQDIQNYISRGEAAYPCVNILVDRATQYLNDVDNLREHMLPHYLEIASILCPQTVYSILNTGGKQAVNA